MGRRDSVVGCKRSQARQQCQCGNPSDFDHLGGHLLSDYLTQPDSRGNRFMDDVGLLWCLRRKLDNTLL
jgi:hypothetical protein